MAKLLIRRLAAHDLSYSPMQVLDVRMLLESGIKEDQDLLIERKKEKDLDQQQWSDH